MRVLTLFSLLGSLLGAVPIVACGASSSPKGGEAASPNPNAASDPHDLTRARAKTILGAATDWRAEHAAGACPSCSDLKAARNLSALADDLDAWGRPYAIQCTASDTRVVSKGPDGVAANGDDVVSEPAPAPQSKAAPAAEQDKQAISNDPAKPSFASDGAVEGQIKATILARVTPRAKECFVRAGSPRGAVVGKIIVAPDGTKRKGSLSSVGGCPAEVVTCVGRAIEELSFDANGGQADRVVDFHYP